MSLSLFFPLFSARLCWRDGGRDLKCIMSPVCLKLTSQGGCFLGTCARRLHLTSFSSSSEPAAWASPTYRLEGQLAAGIKASSGLAIHNAGTASPQELKLIQSFSPRWLTLGLSPSLHTHLCSFPGWLRAPLSFQTGLQGRADGKPPCNCSESHVQQRD